MGGMDHPPVPPPPPTLQERCYRHPDVPTGVHCTRCGRPICPECMIAAPVGHQCPECVGKAKQEFRRPQRRVVTGPQRGLTVTNILLIVLGAVYLWETATTGPGTFINGPSARDLVKLGGDVGVLVAGGERWRLFTAMFLHIGIFHILFNAYALYIFGTIVEAESGRIRFLAAFLISGLFASAVSYAFGDPLVPSAGASGAIFGLFGVFLGASWRRRNLAFYAQRVRSAMGLILINAVFSLTFPGIDWRAHAGGLVAGLVIGLSLDGLGTPASRRWLSWAVTAGLVVVGYVLVTWRTEQLQPLVQSFGLG
jgi:MYXO-CTERM domain-containing protein